MTIPIVLKKKINNKMIIKRLSQMSSILVNIKKDRFESRDDWIKLGMILHHEFNGDDLGLNIGKLTHGVMRPARTSEGDACTSQRLDRLRHQESAGLHP